MHPSPAALEARADQFDDRLTALETLMQKLLAAAYPPSPYGWADLHVPHQERLILEALRDGKPRTREMLMARMEADRSTADGRDEHAFTTVLSKLRTRLARLAPPIAIWRVQPHTYQLLAEDMARLAARELHV